ncbi:MAG: HD-GYP domain-containing protein [Thermoleophilia bacterium]|nr:HD-GYP domain-containing protein [Thermoleophilia bacterium]
MEISAGFLAAFLGVAIVGPLGAFLIAVVSQLPGLHKRPREQTLCYASTSGIVTGCAALLYWGLLQHLGGFLGASVAVVAIVGLGCGVCYQFLNYILGVPVIWLRRGIGFRRAWNDGVKPFLPFDLFFLAICLGLISIYHLYLSSAEVSTLYSTLLVMLCLMPVVGLIYSFRAYANQRELARGNERLARRNERLALQAIASQITALDLKDNYTARHSASVALWARDIAAYMGLSERERNLVHLASLLHDVGKIGVPDELLKSSSRLDPENWSLIESHCLNGYRILRNISQFEGLASVVLSHHEHYDGNGYPGGLAGEDIPLFSRIICVADSYSAMVSNRPYGPPLSTEVAMAELEYKKGTQFDPLVADAFLAVLEEHDEDYRRGVEVDFNLEVDRIKYLRDLPPEMTQDEMLAMAEAAAPAPAPEGALLQNAQSGPRTGG